MREEVFRNVSRCKEAWLHSNAKIHDDISLAINFRTAEMQPLETLPREESEKKNWVKVNIEESEGDVPHFSLSDLNGKPLNINQIDAFVWQVATETLEALNELVNAYYNSQLPSVFPAMNRFEIEQILKGQKIGTYILNRADRYLEDIAQSLSETNRTMVVLYLLTLLEEKNHPIQYVIVASKWGWTILQDMPDLKSDVYQYVADFTSLLETLPSERKFLLSRVE